MSEEKVLTQKQQRFVEEYLVDLNATQAAIRAGYPLPRCVKPAGYYVYLLIDPRNEEIFYVGKGKGNRFAAHTREWRTLKVANGRKHDRIGIIMACGHEPRAAVFAEGIAEGEAYALEAQLIELLGDGLTNLTSGTETQEQKLKSWARDMAMRIQPLDEWVAEFPLGTSDKSLWLNFGIYHVVMRTIAEATMGREAWSVWCAQNPRNIFASKLEAK